ncbi:30S ribosomal protein S10 [Candidatus Deianiraea vastatrix]|uniref:Small ribosomal subunit protein uS10 n=1 Tax=Candidatus Deianiraea vastatrix TaxID=2163644 RepID=A0A5B8XHH9_9RICK|nr:30S ribosomal protein S10 [Candidatus Deianiraea vastatrix]QED23594.1 30S ribosomal protein S10 [Candidatus Deianiraea vastatrix]
MGADNNRTNQKIIVKAQSFDSKVLDDYMLSLVSIANVHGGYIIGPVPLPLRESKFVIDVSRTIDKSRHSVFGAAKTKHIRIIYIFDESGNDNLINQIAMLVLPHGIGVEIKSQE